MKNKNPMGSLAIIKRISFVDTASIKHNFFLPMYLVVKSNHSQVN